MRDSGTCAADGGRGYGLGLSSRPRAFRWFCWGPEAAPGRRPASRPVRRNPRNSVSPVSRHRGDHSLAFLHWRSSPSLLGSRRGLRLSGPCRGVRLSCAGRRSHESRARKPMCPMERGIVAVPGGGRTPVFGFPPGSFPPGSLFPSRLYWKAGLFLERARTERAGSPGGQCGLRSSRRPGIYRPSRFWRSTCRLTVV
jgi:hypothetical protein